MKNAGVPFTPLRTPPRKSLRTFGLVFPALQRALQLELGKAQLAGQDEQQGQAQSILIFVDCVMHLPEAAVCAGEFRALRGGFGVGMDLGQGKMAEDESQLSAEVLPHGLTIGCASPQCGHS